jgi:hypothetical protein
VLGNAARVGEDGELIAAKRLGREHVGGAVGVGSHGRKLSCAEVPIASRVILASLAVHRHSLHHEHPGSWAIGPPRCAHARSRRRPRAVAQQPDAAWADRGAGHRQHPWPPTHGSAGHGDAALAGASTVSQHGHRPGRPLSLRQPDVGPLCGGLLHRHAGLARPGASAAASRPGRQRADLAPAHHPLGRHAARRSLPRTFAPRGPRRGGRRGDRRRHRPAVAGATVVVSWNDLSFDAKTMRAITNDHVGSVRADSSGQFRACMVPTGTRLLLQVQHAQRAGAVVTLFVDDTIGVARRDFSLSPREAQPIAAAATASDTMPPPPSAVPPRSPVRSAAKQERRSARRTSPSRGREDRPSPIRSDASRSPGCPPAPSPPRCGG